MSIIELIKQRLDTNLLRFIAVIAVVNSHLDFLYPKGYSFFATGGAIGNSLFFFSSGFGLWFGLQYLNKTSFLQWFGKRCSRIYPPYLVILPFLILILLHTGDVNVTRVINVGAFVFFPHQAYWFLQAMVLFYVTIFIIFSMSKNVEKTLNISIVFFIIFYLISYLFFIDLTIFSIESLPFRLIFYFICILFGMHLAKRGSEMLFNTVLSTIGVIMSIVIFFASKYLMKKGIGFEFQVVQHAAILSLIIFMFSLSRTKFNIWLRKSTLMSRAIDYISAHSLEIYLIHLPIIFFMRYNEMYNTLYIIPLLTFTLVASKYLKITSNKFLIKLGMNRA